MGYIDKSFNLTKSDLQEREFDSYLSTFNNYDRVNDRIFPKAFDETVKRKPTVSLLWQHESKSIPIGILNLSIDDYGLRAKGKLFNGEKADVAYELIKSGAISDLSVGMYVEEYEPNDQGGLDITKASVQEGSLVLMPANEQAKIMKVKEHKKEGNKLKLDKELTQDEAKALLAQLSKIINDSVDDTEEDIEELKATPTDEKVEEDIEQLESDQEIDDEASSSANNGVEPEADEVVDEAVSNVALAQEEDIESYEDKADPEVLEVDPELDGELNKPTNLKKSMFKPNGGNKKMNKTLKEFNNEMNKLQNGKRVEIGSLKSVSLEDKKQKTAMHLEKADTGLENVLPQPVRSEIQDFFLDDNGINTWFEYKTGIFDWEEVYQTNKNFASSHADLATKTIDSLSFANRRIQSGDLYSLEQFAHSTKVKDTQGIYWRYAMSQLVKSITRGLEFYSVIGTNSQVTVANPNFLAITQDTDTNFVSTATITKPEANAPFTQAEFDQFVEASDLVTYNGDLAVIANRQVIRQLISAKDGNGQYLFGDKAPSTRVENGLQLDGYTFFISDDLPATELVILAKNAYTVIGQGLGAEEIERYDIMINADDVEMVSVTGGALTKFKGAAVVTIVAS
jgi:HK97 family phage prohead protease